MSAIGDSSRRPLLAGSSGPIRSTAVVARWRPRDLRMGAVARHNPERHALSPSSGSVHHPDRVYSRFRAGDARRVTIGKAVANTIFTNSVRSGPNCRACCRVLARTRTLASLHNVLSSIFHGSTGRPSASESGPPRTRSHRLLQTIDEIGTINWTYEWTAIRMGSRSTGCDVPGRCGESSRNG